MQNGGDLERLLGTGGGWVYWMVNGDFVKIGRTDQLVSRLDAYQTGSPTEVSFAIVVAAGDSRRAEAMLHDWYAEHRVRGEWFRITGRVSEDMDKFCSVQDDRVLLDVRSTTLSSRLLGPLEAKRRQDIAAQIARIEATGDNGLILEDVQALARLVLPHRGKARR